MEKVFYRKDIDLDEKVFYLYLLALQQEEASREEYLNKVIAEHLNVSERKITRLIKSLTQKGYIRVAGGHSYKRVIIVREVD